jgi:hypothetical protein
MPATTPAIKQPTFLFDEHRHVAARNQIKAGIASTAARWFS